VGVIIILLNVFVWFIDLFVMIHFYSEI